MSERAHYSTLQISLHWLIAITILVNWITGDGMGHALRDRINAGETGFGGNTLHTWGGTLIFGLVLIRIVVRLVQGAPRPEPVPQAWMETAALWGHRALYALMVLVPVTGALSWYLPLPIMGDPHELLSNLLMWVIGGHALAAIGHHYVLQDGTLRRMLRRRA